MFAPRPERISLGPVQIDRISSFETHNYNGGAKKKFWHSLAGTKKNVRIALHA